MRYNEYPPEYREMFAKARLLPVEIVFTTMAKAIAFRVELYKYRYAVRDALPKTQPLYNKVMKITMSVQNKTLTLQTKKSKFVEKLNEH
jgi:hypothetical protein